ncbi:hypothetical protein M9458_058191 [Cirrhinus mrigala]|uniref:DNA-directed DNA polymerase n=1 Tax=Cirrhinus mrigala TaxID=683832 RepID=A0ABD0MB92_CIRMR
MADNYDDTFDNLEFDDGLMQILDQIFDEVQLVTFDDDDGVNNGEVNASNDQLVILPAEEALLEIVVTAELQHSSDNVTGPAHTNEPTPEVEVHTPDVMSSSGSCNTAIPDAATSEGSFTGVRGVKRLRHPGCDDTPSTSRFRTLENNEQDYDEAGLTAWSDSQVQAWDEARFTETDQSEEEAEEDLPHEISHEVFRDRDLNRRLDYDMLGRVNRNFERVLDLVGPPLSYRDIETAVETALVDVLSILRNIITCQQQHNEALGHAAAFWRNCHEELYNEFRQFQHDMDGLPEEVNQQRAEMSDQLRELINNQLQMLQPESLNMIERLHELVDEQHEWLSMSIHNNDEQIGAGPSDDPSGYDPSAPNMGLSQNCITRLIREGGRVGDFTVVPRPRFNGLEIRRTVNFREIATNDYAAYHVFMHDILNEIVDFSRLLAGETGFLNVSLQGTTLPTDINAVLTPDNDHDVSTFVDQIERAVQSNTDVGFDSALQLCVSVARNKQGGARRKLSDLAHNEVIKKNKMNLFNPGNIADNMCFSICLARFLNPQCPDRELFRIANIIHTELGYDPQDKIAYHDVSKFESHSDLKIVIFHRSYSGKLEVYKNTDDPHPKTVHMYLHDDHYYMIKNLKAFLGYSYVCEYCYHGFKDRSSHYCKFTCNVCKNPMCYTHPKKSMQCEDCLRYCRSNFCYEMHKQPQRDGVRSPCDLVKYCDRCCRQYRAKWSGDKLIAHKCRPSHCVHCGEVLVDEEEDRHSCYIQPITPEVYSERYIYFDFETMYENGKHVANYVCAMTQSGEQFTAEGVDCVDRMVKHFRRPKFENFTFIAHNSSGFDSFILLEYFTSQGLAPKIILQGCRLVYMYDQVFKQRYIDSYSFLPMKLSKLPSALNLNTNEKGFFPHHFNRLENANYVGPYPSKEHYGYQTMSNSDRAKFDEWYDSVAGQVFDFKKQLGMYCRNDVVLLREACMKYRKEFIECTKVDPFGCITLAGCAMKVFKTLFLTKETIALTHKNAYINQYKSYSNPSIEWLEYIKASRNVDVHHALNHGEAKFGPYHVDGYYELNGDRITMDPASRLVQLRQGNRHIEQYVMDFCELCHLVDFQDSFLKDIFFFGLNKDISVNMPRHHRHWSLIRYIDYALLMAGSAFTVGVADDKPYHPPVPATPIFTHVMSGIVTIMPETSPTKSAKPKSAQVKTTQPKLAHVTSAKPQPAHVTSAKPQPAHVMSAKPQPAHVMPAAPGPAHAMPAAPGPAHAMPATSGPAHAMPATPESAPVMAALPQPAHKMAAIPEPVHKMAAIPKPVHKMAAIPKPVHKMDAIPKPVHKMAAPIGSPAKMAATPEPHQIKVISPKSHLAISAAPKTNQVMPDPPVSSQVRATLSVPSQDTAVLHEPSQDTAVLHESSQDTAAVLHESSQDTAVVLHESSQDTAVVLHESSQDTAVVPHESSQVTAVPHESSQVTAVPHESSQVTAVPHESSQVTAVPHESSHVVPESSHVVPESSHVVPESSHVVPESSHVVPESSHVVPESSQVSKSSQVAAASPGSSQVAAAFPESSQVFKSSQVTAVVPVSSQATAAVPVSSQAAAVVPASSQVKAVFPVSSQVRAAPLKSSQVTATAPVSSKAIAVAPKSSKVTTDLHEPSQATVDLHELSQITADLHEPSQVAAVIPEPSQATGDLHESSQATGDLHESSQATVDLHEPSQATADLQNPSQVTAGLHEPGQVTAVLHESGQVTAGLPESSQVTAGLPESSQVTAGLPESSQETAVLPEPNQVTSDLPKSHHISAEPAEPTLPSHAEPTLPSHAEPTFPSHKSIASTPSRSTDTPLSTVLPVMAIAIFSVWAAHCAPRASSVHESASEASSIHESGPEASSVCESGPEASSVHESAPEAPSIHESALEALPDCESAPEASSDHTSASEASVVHEFTPIPPEVSAQAVDLPKEVAPIYELPATPAQASAPMPPEVSAPAVDPPMGAASSYELSLCPVTTRETYHEPSACHVMVKKANRELSTCHVTAKKAYHELSDRHVTAKKAYNELSACHATAKVVVRDHTALLWMSLIPLWISLLLSALPALPVLQWLPVMPAPPTSPWLPVLPALLALPWLPALPASPWLLAMPALPAPPWLPALPAPPWLPALPAPPWLPALPAPPWLPALPAPPWLPALPALPAPVFHCLPLLHGPGPPVFHCLPLLHGPGPPRIHCLPLIHSPGPPVLHCLPLLHGPGPPVLHCLPLLHSPVHDIWECQWDKAKQNDPDVRAFMTNYTAPARLNPRDALFGGRTNAFKLYHKVSEDERISYLDFTSLYPYVQSRKTYPIGHPEIILKDFGPVESYFGLIKCTVVPPRRLLHPVLPFRSSSSKLLFALCRTFAEEQLQKTCQHSDEERSISGTWVSVELSRAIDKGYSVVRIDEVWHFPQTSDTLFSDYVKTFLKFKQEASGFPPHIVTEVDKQSYVEEYFEKEGVQLDIDKITLNPARRSINKYLLNSLWGRFALRCNLPTAELLTDPEDFARHFFGNGHIIKHFSFVSDSVALVQWCYAEEDPAPARDVNVFIGAFTTAYGRLELYNYMDRLGPRVFYADTDSLVFISKNGEWMPQTGAYLGELTDELDAQDFISEFASTGPKSDGYRTAKNKVTLKVKGITLHSINADIITLESMICLVQGYVTSRDTTHLLTRTETIVRNKKKFTLHNKSVLKRFKVVYDKRPSGSGKTVFVKNLLCNADKMIDVKIDNIVFLYSCWQPLYDELLSLFDIKFIEGIPKSLNDENLLPPNKKSIVICDDLMDEAYSNVELERAFTKYVHHKSFSIILITQNLFFQAKSSRTITLSTHYIVLYKSPRDSMQISLLGRQIYPGNGKFFMECYQDATNQPFGFLLIDFKAKTPERFRLRSGLFSEYQASPKQRRVILQSASDQLILSLCEIALNVLHGTIPLNTSQLRRLKKRKEEIKYAASKNINIGRKKRMINQRGGFLTRLIMEHAERMYVIPQNQMNKLRSGNVRETIQQVVENDLDGAIRRVLQRSDIDPHGKAKLYTNILQRFLAIVKQGDLESGTLTLTLPKEDATHGDASTTAPASASAPAPAPNNDDGEDQIVDEILSNVPQRSLKNIKYILNKMSNAKQLSSWTASGEFVYRGRVIHGSHMLDLVKSITAPQTIRDEYRPRGWGEFLDAFAALNIPFSTVSNPQVKRMVESLKRKSPVHTQSPSPQQVTPLKKHRGRMPKTRRHPTTRGEDVFKSPSLDVNAWLTF